MITSVTAYKNNTPHFKSSCRGFEMEGATEIVINALSAADKHPGFRASLLEVLPGRLSQMMGKDGRNDELSFFITGVKDMGIKPPIVTGELSAKRGSNRVVAQNPVNIKSMANKDERYTLGGYTYDLYQLIETCNMLGHKLDEMV